MYKLRILKGKNKYQTIGGFIFNLFARNKPQLNKFVSNNSITFKDQIKQNIIPRVLQMIENEKKHLNWLIDNNAPRDMIERSYFFLTHFRQRYDEYVKYVEDLR